MVLLISGTRNHQHGKMSLKVHQWHSYLDSNLQWSKGTSGMINKWEAVPGSGDLPDFLRLLGLWILENNLLIHHNS